MTGGKLRPIVVGLGGGSAGTGALSWAAREARLAGRPLRLVHAQRDSLSGLLAGAAALAASVDPGPPGEGVQELLGAALDAVALWEPEVEAVARAELGDPIERLLAHGKTAAMLVLGGHDHRASERWTGSIAGVVAAHAACPVVLVNGQPAWPDAPIVVGLDDPTTGVDALEFAFGLATRRAVPLRVHHVVRRDRGRCDRPDMASRTEAALARHAIRYPRVTVELECAVGDPVHTLTEAAANAQLLVLGPIRRTIGAVITGSGRRALLRRAPCPVAVVGHRTGR